MIRLAFAAALLAAAAPAPSLVGHYELTGVPEAGSELELSADGRFTWMLAHGAVDETAAGTWRMADGRVVLDSDPPIVPPVFELVSQAKDPDNDLLVKVILPNGRGLALVDVEVGFDHGEPMTGYTQDYGYHTSLPPRRRVTGLRLGIDMVHVTWKAFPIDLASGGVVTFRFIPNDVGKYDFRAASVTVARDALTLDYRGKPLPYERMSEGSKP